MFLPQSSVLDGVSILGTKVLVWDVRHSYSERMADT